ncbi:DUF3226 domain-containing protein [Candidatus Mycalebacterium sp.]
MPNVFIFVEGEEDRLFLKSYILHLNLRISKCIKDLGGRGNLTRPSIEKKLDRGSKVLVILDAENDFNNTQSFIKRTLGNLDVKIFLFPDNELKGNLENLLEEIINLEHKDIFDCFEEYKKCLSNKNINYEHPDLKAKIYSYREALGIQDKKEDHFKSDCWDFENDALTPLREFLERELV